MVEASDHAAGDGDEGGERRDPLRGGVRLPHPIGAELHAPVHDPQQCQHRLALQRVDDQAHVAGPIQPEPVLGMPPGGTGGREATDDVRGLIEVRELHARDPRLQILQCGVLVEG